MSAGLASVLTDVLAKENMKVSEKIQVVGSILGIIAIITLFQSPSLNFIAMLMAINLAFRYAPFFKKKSFSENESCENTGVIGTPNRDSGTFTVIVDGVCSLVVTVVLVSLPGMLLYLISPYQTVNFIVGTILGILLVTTGHSRIFKLARIWVWFITFNLSMAFIIAVKALIR